MAILNQSNDGRTMVLIASVAIIACPYRVLLFSSIGCSFLFLQIVKNRLKIIIEFGSMGLARFSHFIHDWVSKHTYPPKSSSGVQITGVSCPSAKQ